MRTKITCILLAILLMLFLSIPVFADTGSRIALVIGNADYKFTPRLANPVNDAKDLAQTLEELEFKVYLATDLTLAEMDREVQKFIDVANRTQPQTALFFYAGHGVQYEGINYDIWRLLHE